MDIKVLWYTVGKETVTKSICKIYISNHPTSHSSGSGTMQKSILIGVIVNKHLYPNNEKSNRTSDAKKRYYVCNFVKRRQSEKYILIALYFTNVAN